MLLEKSCHKVDLVDKKRTMGILVINETTGVKILCESLYEVEMLTKIPARIAELAAKGSINCSIHGWSIKTREKAVQDNDTRRQGAEIS
jgi:hypothetical protein